MASRLSGRPVRVGNSAVSEAPSRSRRRSCRSSLLRWWTIKRPSPGPKLCRHFEGESLHEQAFLRPHRHNPHVGIRPDMCVDVALVVDAYARRILGWRVAATMATSMVLDAIEQAIWTRQRSN